MAIRNRHDLTSEERKQMPLHRGTLKYFPDALMVVAMLSKRADLKHSPDADPNDPSRPQWVKGKSPDHGDCIARHQTDIGEVDPEVGLDYMVHVAWRGLAQLQQYIDVHGIDAVVDWNWQPPLPVPEVSEYPCGADCGGCCSEQTGCLLTSERTDSEKVFPPAEGFMLTTQDMQRVGLKRGHENPSPPVTPAERQLAGLLWNKDNGYTAYPGPDVDSEGRVQ